MHASNAIRATKRDKRFLFRKLKGVPLAIDKALKPVSYNCFTLSD